MKEELLKIMSGYRISLPKKFREKHGLKIGDYVNAVWNDDKALQLFPGKVIFKVTLGPKEGEDTDTENNDGGQSQ
jgi:bifunctional DNA-binding transcriptional regulator/antitoxin component of YhaV-PrlF toxin-antitoxin module